VLGSRGVRDHVTESEVTQRDQVTDHMFHVIMPFVSGKVSFRRITTSHEYCMSHWRISRESFQYFQWHTSRARANRRQISGSSSSSISSLDPCSQCMMFSLFSSGLCRLSSSTCSLHYYGACVFHEAGKSGACLRSRPTRPHQPANHHHQRIPLYSTLHRTHLIPPTSHTNKDKLRQRQHTPPASVI